MEERLINYKENEKRISQLNEDIASLEQDKIEMDSEIKISSANMGCSSGKNKKDYVKNNIEPQVIERQKKLDNINKSIRANIAERSKLLAYQENTRTMVQFSCSKTEYDIISKKYFENYNPSEISRELDITENGVHKILKRVMKKLKA